jgi:phosphinothricin acetyltransferase
VSLTIRKAEPGDAEAIAAIHDEAVLAGNATLRSEPRPLEEVRAVLGQGHPFLVAEDGAEVVGWASAGPYEESNPYYSGVREAAVYVAGTARGKGAGQALLDALAERAAAANTFKLVAKVFTTNEASLRLFERAGYSEVGTHLRHGQLRGEWKDVVVLEKHLQPGSDP